MEPADPTTPARKPIRKNDTCYHCQTVGHWAANCPVKNPNKFQTSTPSPERADLQLVRCTCGSACNVLTSRTDDNPSRRFYTCSTKKCKFFKWCDEVKLDAPMCTCRAGKCSINTDRGRCWYFACRIKKGLGACSFIQWVDSQDNLAVTNADSSNEKLPNLMEIDAPVTANQNCPNLGDDQELGMGAWIKKFDEISNTRCPSESDKSSEMETEDGNLNNCKAILKEDELTPEDIDKLEYFIDRTSKTLFRPSAREISDRQRQFVNQINAAGVELTEDDTPLIPRLSRPKTAAADQDPQQHYVSILKKAALDIKHNFISRLNSPNTNPHALEEEATNCFLALESIRLDHQEFKSNVTQYIHSLSTLSAIDADPTFQELVDRDSREKRKFEEVCSIHLEKSCSYKACGDKIEELKKMKQEIEQEIEQCETEYREKELCLFEINQVVKRAKKSMEMVDREVDEVRRRREVERAAAKAALNEARVALLEQ